MTRQYQVHRCRFVDYVPAAINALAFSPPSGKGQMLAVGRENGDIELWNVAHDYHHEKTIPGTAGNSLEALVWTCRTESAIDDADSEEENGISRVSKTSETRLFSAGLDALIVEWDTLTLQPKKTAESNGGGVWSLCANNSETKLAVGCEDGSLRIFSLIDGSLEYERALDRADGRVLSISWADNDLTLFAGCSDSSIRKYDVATGRITGRMTVDTVRSGGAREDTMVWAVKALKSGALVSGDSLGNVLIWDSKSCTLIQGIKAHKADVLCLVANEEGDRIYSSGIDRMIIQIGLVKDNAPTPSKKTKAAAKTANSSRWVVTGEKRYHSHDVRALALYNQRPHEVLVSGGVDTTLTLASPIRKFPHVSPRRLQPFPHRPLIAISRESRVLLARMGDDRLKLFKLGEPEESYKSDGESIEAPFDGQVIPRQSGWKHLLEIKVKAESNLICSTISHSGRFLACSDIASTKIYAISLTFKPKRVQLDLPPSNAMCFTPDSSKLIIGTLNSKIQVIDLASLQIIASFDEHKVATILDIKCSEDGQWCATGDCKGQIQVYNFGSLKHHATLPAFPQFTSLAFHSFSPSLVITTYENKFFVFDVVENRLTDWAKEYSDKLPYRFTNRKEKILGSCFPRRDEEEYRNNIWLWGAEMWCVADLDKPVGDRKSPLTAAGKRKHADEAFAAAAAAATAAVNSTAEVDQDESISATTPADHDLTIAAPSSNFNMSHKFNSILFMDFLDDKQMVVVERPVLEILKALPEAFYKRKYGA